MLLCTYLPQTQISERIKTRKTVSFSVLFHDSCIDSMVMILKKEGAAGNTSKIRSELCRGDDIDRAESGDFHHHKTESQGILKHWRITAGPAVLG